MKHIQSLLLTLLGLASMAVMPVQVQAQPAPAPVITPAIQPAPAVNAAAQASNTPPTTTADTQQAAPPQPAYNPPTPNNPYEITGIAVDVTADSAVHARDQALTSAQRSGLQQLCDHLGVDKTVTDKLSDNDIATLVQNFAVEDQHTSAVRYVGHYTVQYRQNAVRNWLVKKGLTYNEPGTNTPAPAGAANTADAQNPPPANDVLTVVTTPDTQPTNHLYAAVTITSLQQWAQIQSRLNNIAAVKQVNVLNLTKSSSHIDIEFRGDLESFRALLGQNRLQLSQPTPGTEWVLQFI